MASKIPPFDEPADKNVKPVNEKPKRTEQGEVPSRPRRHAHWVWPLGLAVAGIGGAAAFMLRGCWHTRMAWPTKFDDEFSYQVCIGCGIKRLYDETTFHAYGPYGYDIHELIARERTTRMRRLKRHEEELARRRAKAEPPPQAKEHIGD